MGTAPPSKPLSEPARPFKRKQHRACLQHTFLPKPRKDPTVLLHLISRREWQKVLIRTTLYPSEVTQRQKMTWYGVQWSLLPLHLACALQPPSKVISMLLSFHSDTARVLMKRCSPPPSRKKRQWRRSTNKKKLAASEENNYALYRSNQGQHYVVPKIDTAPSSSDDEEQHPTDDGPSTAHSRNYANSDSGSLLEDKAFAMDADRTSRLHVFETHDESTDSEDEHSAGIAVPPEMLPDYTEVPAPDYAANDGHNDEASKSQKKSTNVSPAKRNVALQLSANGSLNPMEIESPSISKNPSRMQWNLDPLLMEADALLPLHIACLYHASPTVITYLLDAYPKAAQETALGMIPIHMACAGFQLPSPILAPPPGPVPFPMNDEYDMPETLRRLEKAFPDSIGIPSQMNGMTPKTYIEETLDDGSYKNECLEAMGVATPSELVEEVVEIAETLVSDYDHSTLTTRVPDEVHCGDDNSTLPSFQTETSSKYLGQDLPQINGFSGSRLYSKMATKNWESALSIIEERPKDARKWQYGIELDRIESINSAGMWKRLPIHSACVLHAPIGVIEALLWAYPKGIEIKDPFTGALPLHLACRHSAPPELVKTVITGYPEGSHIADDDGRLPLHLACISGASRLTFIYLLKAYPHAVLMKDERRKSSLQYAKQNPTLKSETVELLELVHHFLENQPEVEDDYSFEGFQPPRSVGHCSDDGSVVSGFYETRIVASARRTTNSDDDLDSSSPLSGSQASADKETAERLVREFSQILEEKYVTPSENEPTVTKLAPRFSSKAHTEIDPELPSQKGRSVPVEELSKISEEDSAFDDTETEPEDGTSDPHEGQISHEDNSFEPAESIDAETEREDGTLETDEMPISQEDKRLDVASSIASNEDALVTDTPSRLGALMTRNQDALTPEGSLMCLNGSGEYTRDDQENIAQGESEAEEALEVTDNDFEGGMKASCISEANPSSDNAIEGPEDTALPSKELDHYIDESTNEETSDTDKLQDHLYHVDVSVEASEQESPSGDSESAGTGFVEVNLSLSDTKDEESPIPVAETKDEARNSLSIERVERSVPDDGISASVLPSRDVDPADEAAGCFSPVNVPAFESSNEDVAQEDAGTINVEKTNDLSTGDAQKCMNKKDKMADIEFIPYQPLVLYALDEVEASTTASNDQRLSLDSLSSRPDRFLSATNKDCSNTDVTVLASNTYLSSRPDRFLSATNKDCSTTDVTVLASNTSAQTSQRASVYTGDSAASLYCPNHDTITDGNESEKKPNENSTEFQFDYKSDQSQTGDSVTDVESTTSTTFSEPHEDEPVFVQERDDKNRTSSPKQEERLDIL